MSFPVASSYFRMGEAFQNVRRYETFGFQSFDTKDQIQFLIKENFYEFGKYFSLISKFCKLRRKGRDSIIFLEYGRRAF